MSTDAKGAYRAPLIYRCLEAEHRACTGCQPDWPAMMAAAEAEVNRLSGRVRAVLEHIGDTGCSCPGDVFHASLPDHELDCFAQIEHLLTAANGDSGAGR